MLFKFTILLFLFILLFCITFIFVFMLLFILLSFFNKFSSISFLIIASNSLLFNSKSVNRLFAKFSSIPIFFKILNKEGLFALSSKNFKSSSFIRFGYCKSLNKSSLLPDIEFPSLFLSFLSFANSYSNILILFKRSMLIFSCAFNSPSN